MFLIVFVLAKDCIKIMPSCCRMCIIGSNMTEKKRKRANRMESGDVFIRSCENECCVSRNEKFQGYFQTHFSSAIQNDFELNEFRWTKKYWTICKNHVTRFGQTFIFLTNFAEIPSSFGNGDTLTNEKIAKQKQKCID